MGKQPKRGRARVPWRKPCRGRPGSGAALILLAALAACQAEPPPLAEQPPCRTSWEDCRVATRHQPRWRVPHRGRVKTAFHRRPPAGTRRDVDAILEGMRRARAAPRIAPSPADSSP